ncbi:MAG: hypothetical protein CVV49_04755 [Spirochaetae bacterium HGW-Spirochaetae-5]|nr:MAG: hypothetical protein CVV49_04755 [Spirochaetae bacterium HGW-Spirochaetae-5]
MTRFKIAFMILVLFICTNSFSQGKAPADTEGGVTIEGDSAESAAFDYMMGGVFGAITIDGKNYQQIGLRPELKLWKFGIGLDINVLLDEDGKVREEDWDEAKDYIDKIYYISFGKKGEPFYFKYGGLQSTTLGYGTLISGYTNLLEYPTYKRQGIDISIDTKYAGMEAVVGNFKNLAGKNKAIMGGGRIYVKPFRRLQIGGSYAGDMNEYKGLRDTDDDGYPDEVDMYPEDDRYVTEIDYWRGQGVPEPVISSMTSYGVISSLERSQLKSYSDERSRTGFWAADAGLRLINAEYFKIDIYTQFSQSVNTGGWGYTAPGVRITGGRLFEIYGDYRQQSDDFIFGYYNDTYDLERAKYVKDAAGDLHVETKKDKLNEAISSKGYLAGLKLNFFDVITGKAEYQDMRWGRDGEIKDKSLKGELALNKYLFPLISMAKVYYVQNNVEKIQWKTESTVIGGVLGLGVAEGVTVEFNYLITYQDVNGDGEIEGEDEEIRNISLSTTSRF